MNEINREEKRKNLLQSSRLIRKAEKKIEVKVRLGPSLLIKNIPDVCYKDEAELPMRKASSKASLVLDSFQNLQRQGFIEPRDKRNRRKKNLKRYVRKNSCKNALSQ